MGQTRAEAIAVRQIEPGERLLWAGSPKPGAAALAALPASLLGLPFAGFAVFWIWSATGTTSGPAGPVTFFPLLAVPFLLIGAGMFLAPLWGFLRARGTVYAITGRRAMTIVRSGAGGVRTHSFADIKELVRTEHPDGSGLVFFGWRARGASRGDVLRSPVGFVSIPEAHRVESLIRDHILERAA